MVADEDGLTLRERRFQGRNRCTSFFLKRRPTPQLLDYGQPCIERWFLRWRQRQHASVPPSAWTVGEVTVPTEQNTRRLFGFGRTGVARCRCIHTRTGRQCSASSPSPRAALRTPKSGGRGFGQLRSSNYARRSGSRRASSPSLGQDGERRNFVLPRIEHGRTAMAGVSDVAGYKIQVVFQRGRGQQGPFIQLRLNRWLDAPCWTGPAPYSTPPPPG